MRNPRYAVAYLMTREEVATLKNGQIIYDLWTFHSAAYNSELTRTVISTSSNLETVEVSLGTYRGRSYSGAQIGDSIILIMRKHARRVTQHIPSPASSLA